MQRDVQIKRKDCQSLTYCKISVIFYNIAPDNVAWIVQWCQMHGWNENKHAKFHPIHLLNGEANVHAIACPMHGLLQMAPVRHCHQLCTNKANSDLKHLEKKAHFCYRTHCNFINDQGMRNYHSFVFVIKRIIASSKVRDCIAIIRFFLLLNV